MNFNEYQQKAKTTAIYRHPIMYPALGLAGETGEVCEKVKKVLRDNNGIFSEDKKKEIEKEISDCMWYIANLSSDLGLSLEEILQTNLSKLMSRKERGVLGGSGDNR